MKCRSWSRTEILVVMFTIVSGMLLIAYSEVHANPLQWLRNGDFEEKDGAGWWKDVHFPTSALTYDKEVVHSGKFSIKIGSASPNNAAWIQKVMLVQDAEYQLSGWIKTENVLPSEQDPNIGAYIDIADHPAQSVNLFGTNDWTYVSFVFKAEKRNGATVIALRLGTRDALTTGTVWFDDLQLAPVISENGFLLLRSDFPYIRLSRDGRIGYYKYTTFLSNVDTRQWSPYFDGSDVGVHQVDGLTMLDDGSLLLSLAQTEDVPGLGTIEGSDVIHFLPSQLGPRTSGRFERYFDGSDVGLDTNRENIDALDLLPDGSLLVSTTGNYTVPGTDGELTGGDEDILRFQPTSLGRQTAGSWSLYFDGSDLNMTSPKEDIMGLSVDPQNGDIYFSVKRFLHAGGITGSQFEIFVCHPIRLGEETRCQLSSAGYWAIAGAFDILTKLPPMPVAIDASAGNADEIIVGAGINDADDADAIGEAYATLDDFFNSEGAEILDEATVEGVETSLYEDGELDEQDSFIFLPMIIGE